MKELIYPQKLFEKLISVHFMNEECFSRTQSDIRMSSHQSIKKSRTTKELREMGMVVLQTISCFS